MDINNQIANVWRVNWHPRSVLSSLPSDKFLIISFLISAYFGYARASRKGFLDMIAQHFGSEEIAYLMLGVLLITTFLLGALLTKGIARLFSREMSFVKSMNIQGYCQAPRLLLAIPISVILAVHPDLLADKVLLWVVIIGGIALVLYSIVLWVLSIKYCPKRVAPY